MRRLSAWVCLPLVLAFADIHRYGRNPAPRHDIGTIVAIEIFRASDNQPVNVGTVLGGIAGGVIGHQIGSGRGNTAATVVGAIGGAVGNRDREEAACRAPVPDYRAARFR